MAQCPRCKEEMPLLSKICPVCKYVVEGGEDDVNPQQFADTMEGCLHAIKSIPEPTFGRTMGHLGLIIFPVLTLFMLIAAIAVSDVTLWILVLIFLGLSILFFVRKSQGKIGNAHYDKQLKKIKTDYEYFERITKRNFGKNSEINNLLEDISSQIHSIEQKRKSIRSRNILIWIIIAVILGAVVFWAVATTDDALTGEPVEQVDKLMERGRYDEAVNIYGESLHDAEMPDNALRIKMIDKMLADGEDAMAEDYFFKYCMGTAGDYDCAARIVTHYRANSENDEAKDFIGKCTGLRYRSDKNKLEKL